jgi:hypothetical protein
VQFEQAEGIVGEYSRGGLYPRGGSDDGKHPVGRIGTRHISGVGFGAGARVIWCRVWCHVHRATGDDHRCGDREPVDDDD